MSPCMQGVSDGIPQEEEATETEGQAEEVEEREGVPKGAEEGGE